MSEISLARIARTLDAMLDDQMTAQARIAAHLVAVAEAAGHDAARVIETLEAVVAATVLDEIWITDEKGFAYLTTVRDEAGVRVPFRFSPDPAVQPQASTFYSLLASPIGGDDAVTQPAQVREIDHEIFKYVGVGGVDRHRIVQVGNAPAFDEQDVVSNAYTSPVMTAVMAAFGEPDLLSAAYTSRLDEIRTVLDGILGHQMIVQARLAECLVETAEEAESSRTEIEGRLRQIVGSTTLGEIHVATHSGDMIYTSLPLSSAGDRLRDGVLDAGDVGRFREGTLEIVHETAPRAFDGAVYKYVSVSGAGSTRLVKVGQPIGPDSPVSLHFPSSGGGGA